MAIRVKRRSPRRIGAEAQKQKLAVAKPIEMELIEQAPQVPIDVDDSVLENDELLKVTVDSLKKSAAIGRQIENLGTVRINNGVLLTSKQFIVNHMRMLQEDSMSGGDFKENAKILATTGNTIARLSKEFRGQNESSHHKAPMKRRGFEPGVAIKVDGNVHLHTK